ncbi:hypothetical protein MAPG_09147 [Magnaporthiopsis poae ATCC 64411]|uniref:Uncharacterized protein n=1 Tax=Magnaporthiopsis poae (strain ATCC 64411 / 73-15) TaxID=644358 RepID=A0A0C4E968_MAGP6|nr:hypothetical protein MAPG_09147 [Magnaporthiopsis poae ATCC 64411]
MSQVPAGTVAGVMLYCCLAFAASSLMIWLTWTHRERTSYIAMLSYFATLSIAASLVQQTHDVVRYRSLVKEQFENRKLHPGNPEIAIANGSVGVSLALYYIQYYCYSVEAMCVMFFAAHLAQTTIASRRWSKLLRRIDSDGGKVFAVLFPLTTILLLRIPQVQSSFVVFILLADLPLSYVRSRRRFLHWTPNGGGGGGGGSAGAESSLESGVATTTTQTGSRKKSGRKQRGIWDRWLMVRFTVAFVALGAFEVTNTLFQIMAVTNAAADLAATEPDLSAERARRTWIFFMPGVTPGLFIFIVFGTTAPLRRYMWETFVPRRWRRGGKREDEEANVATAAAERVQTKSRAHVARPPDDEDDVGPPPPPKDDVVVVAKGAGSGSASEMEMHVYGQRAGRPKDGATRAPRAGEVERPDSDEWPMLPIMRND